MDWEFTQSTLRRIMRNSTKFIQRNIIIIKMVTPKRYSVMGTPRDIKN